MAQPSREPDPNYSFRLLLDIGGRHMAAVWLRMVVVLIGMIVLYILK